MTILYYWKDDKNSMSAWQHIHLLDELKHEHEVLIFDINNFMSHDEIVHNFKLFCKKKKIDLFFTCLHQDFLFESIFDIVDSMSIPKLLIAFDNFHAPFMHLKVAHRFDLVWLTSKETEYLFLERGINTFFLPYAANPKIFINKNQSTINRACFIGSPYGTRPILLNKIGSSGVDLDVYFNQNHNSVSDFSYFSGFKESINYLKFDIGRKVLWSSLIFRISKLDNKLCNSISLFNSVDFKEMYKLYNSYSIVLNLIELRNTAILNTPLLKLHLRTFEIPAAGGVQLVKRSQELLSYFKDNEEILTYADTEELISKALFYTKESQTNTINKIRLKARERVINEHTWKHRFDKIFSNMFK